jgi:hypothetical protein
MSVLLNTSIVEGWQVVIDNVKYIANINAAGSNTGGNQNWGVSPTESAHGILSLLLSSVRMQ